MHASHWVWRHASLRYGNGRLASISNTSSITNLVAYDPMGRVTQSSQVTGSNAYPLVYQCDLAGNLTSTTYPSHLVVNNNYDDAGRITSRIGQKTGSPNKTYADSISYAPHWGMTGLRLGNQLWEQMSYNARLQPAHIGLGPTFGSSDIMSLTYGYGTTNNNGNILSQQIYRGICQSQPVSDVTQNYGYDPLNRLETASEGANRVRA